MSDCIGHFIIKGTNKMATIVALYTEAFHTFNVMKARSINAGVKGAC